jgi:beta-glucosidase
MANYDTPGTTRPNTTMRYLRRRWVHNPTTERFLFAAGIECSYPTVPTPDGGRRREDQLEKTRHYQHWREDLQLTKDLGIRYLRYGPPYYRIHTAPGKYDWSFTDEVLPEMQKLNIVPIMDLCHFGVPDWIGDFQNPDFPRHFAEYARAFAERYPWVWCYTPINEMYIAAEFSAYYGWWNEALASHKAFVTALKHIVRASIEAMLQIIEVRPMVLFVLAESSEHTHSDDPALVDRAEMFNERRFLSLDLTCGRLVDSGMYTYLRDNGMTEDEYSFFLKHNLQEHFIMGHDYYTSNEHLLVEEDRRVFGGDVFGYYVLGRKYYERYNLPVMHTETNTSEPDAERWLWRTWTNIQQLRQDGVPLCGMTWYALVHQVDWNTALREDNGDIVKSGLYDLDRNITAVGRAYQKLIRLWKETPLLPHGPLTVVGDWGAPFREPPGLQEAEHGH